MSEELSPVAPVPEHTPPLEEDAGTQNAGRKFGQPWTRWFIHLREKINLINEIVAGLAKLIGSGGIVVVDNDTVVVRSIQGTANDISVSNGDGVNGDPTIVSTNIISNPGSYGSAVKIPVFTVGSHGKLLAVNEVDAAGGGGGYFNYVDSAVEDVYQTDTGDLYIGL